MSGRKADPPLVDPATDPRRDVGLATAAAFLGVNRLTLRSRIEAGLLPAFRDGKVYRIRVKSLVRYKLTRPTS
jgi:excisionase family DNA binding protein